MVLDSVRPVKSIYYILYVEPFIVFYWAAPSIHFANSLNVVERMMIDLQTKKKYLIFPLGKLVLFYLKYISSYFFQNVHRTSQTIFFDYMQSKLQLTSKVNGIMFDCTTAAGEKRGNRYREKSGDLVCWIDDNIRAGDVFFDVGANIGAYSLYAAKFGAEVYAFEPESLNYSILTKNLFLNQFNKLVAYNIAINGGEEELTTLRISSFKPGFSLHQITGGEVGLDSFRGVFEQGVFAVGLDTLLEKFGLPAPSFLKIDVDGNEINVVLSMTNLLSGNVLRGIAIEINFDIGDNAKIPSILASYGFKEIEDVRYLISGRKVNWFFQR